MTRSRRIPSTPLVLAVCSVVGAMLALATDQAGDGHSGTSQFLNSVGAMAAPWLIIPLITSAGSATAARAAMRGAAATISALVGWYVTASQVEDLGDHGFIGDLRLEFTGNAVYFLAGLISGPVFGSAGYWWRSHRRAPLALVVGALLALEPFYILGATTCTTTICCRSAIRCPH